ncbi:MAG TPA: hypothetical protein VL117_02870, partial [Thermoleophilia bacterium]|nr:hypothetical protein [Thermoleophilia bacterium]
APRRVDKLKSVACGERNDYIWARLIPPLETARRELLDIVLLAPRHVGFSLADSLADPMHVYVCTVSGSTPELPDVVAPEAIDVRYWAVLTADELRTNR